MSEQASITITVNGESRAWPGGTVLELLEGCRLDVAKSGFAVALNAAVLPRGQWPQTALAEGDRIEIVGMYKGG